MTCCSLAINIRRVSCKLFTVELLVIHLAELFIGPEAVNLAKRQCNLVVLAQEDGVQHSQSGLFIVPFIASIEAWKARSGSDGIIRLR